MWMISSLGMERMDGMVRQVDARRVVGFGDWMRVRAEMVLSCSCDEEVSYGL